MAEGVMAVINTIICVFRYNGSIPSEEPVVLSERICASPIMQVSQQKDPPKPDSEKKYTQTYKCPVSILDSRRKHFGSVDLSKRKTFVPESKAAIKTVIPQTNAASKVVSDDKAEGGSQGIIVFTLWYILIAYSYAKGTLGIDENNQPESGEADSVTASDVAAQVVEVAKDIAKELAEPEAEAVLEAEPEPAPEEPAEEPAEEPVEEPAEEPADEPAEEPAEEPTEEPAEEPAE